ncbi:LXG domain-containing protein [Niallia taxi]|nr:LXG domain-containing protein [Niallia taxi]
MKSFFEGQLDVVSAWERFVDRQIAFHEGGAGKLEDKELGGNTKVYLFGGRSRSKRTTRDEMVTEQRRALENIFREIDDLVPLEPFSRSKFDDEMMEVHKKRMKTLDALEEVDSELEKNYTSVNCPAPL